MVYCVILFFLLLAEVIDGESANLSACGCRGSRGHLLPWYTSGFE